MNTASDRESQDAEARPTIIADHELERQTDEAILSLESRGDVYQRGGMLVRFKTDTAGKKLRGMIRPAGEPSIQPIPLSQLHLILSSTADWKKWKLDSKDGPKLVSTIPPDKVVKGVWERGQYPESIRELQALIEAPMLRLDFQVVQEPGYDPFSGLYYLPPKCLDGHAVPEYPNAADIENARFLLLDMICDFPFRAEAHRSAYLAWLLTCFARFAYQGNTPFFLINKNSARTGATLLSQITSHLVVGRQFTTISQHVDEEAERKVITSLAMSGCLYVLFDNINKPFGSAAFDMAVTSGTVSDRSMHTHSMTSAAFMAVMAGTGNNVQFKQGVDTAPRTLEIALETDLDRPETRAGFKHWPLLEYVEEHRAELVMAALTLLRGYCAAGMPDQKLKNWGGFDQWSRLIRHCLVWAGLPDPYEAHEELLESADNDRELREELVYGFKEILDELRVESIEMSEALSEIESDIEYRRHNQAHKFRFPRFHQAMLQLCGIKDGRMPNPRVVSNRLKKYKKTPVRGGIALCPLERGETGVRWTVTKTR